MADHIVIQGVPPYDGRYELDLEKRELTTREWGWIKRLAGYLPAALDEQAFGDPELITALAAIAVRRAGKAQTDQVPRLFGQLSDAPFGAAITLETDREQEDDAGLLPKLELERRRFWAQFEREFGDISIDPAGLWDPRLGFFSVGPDNVGEMTPAQLVSCADLFTAMYGGE